MTPHSRGPVAYDWGASFQLIWSAQVQDLLPVYYSPDSLLLTHGSEDGDHDVFPSFERIRARKSALSFHEVVNLHLFTNFVVGVFHVVSPLAYVIIIIGQKRDEGST